MGLASPAEGVTPYLGGMGRTIIGQLPSFCLENPLTRSGDFCGGSQSLSIYASMAASKGETKRNHSGATVLMIWSADHNLM